MNNISGCLKFFLASGIVLLCSVAADAKVLFLAHWNDTLTAEYAAGEARPVKVAGAVLPQTTGGGYPFNNSMPAIGGLKTGDNSVLMYSTRKNINPAEGTISFWLYPQTPFKPGHENPFLFNTNVALTQSDQWKSIIGISYGGWSDVLRFSIYDDSGASASVHYNTERWKPKTNWHFVTCTWSASKHRIRLYIDGKLVQEKNNVSLPTKLPNFFFIGSLNGWHHFAGHSYDELRILDREIPEVQVAIDYSKKSEFTPEDKTVSSNRFVPISLKDIAKTPLEDDQAGDQKGGWTDQGPKADMRNLKRGYRKPFGVDFVIGDKCIVLASGNASFYPTKAIIPIKNKFSGLLFVHAAAWMMSPDKTAAWYKIKYKDGSMEKVPLNSYQNIGDWAIMKELPNACPVLQCKGGFSGRAGAFLFFWENPHPEKGISELIFESSQGDAIPILLAVTGVKTGVSRPVLDGLKVLTQRKKDDLAEYQNALLNYKEALGKIPSLKKELAGIQISEQERMSFYGREAQRKLEEGKIYLQSVESDDKKYQKAIKIKDLSITRKLKLTLAYIGYIPEIIANIHELQKKASVANLIKPLRLTDFASATKEPERVAAKLRQELLLNGPWEKSDSNDPDNCKGNWVAQQVPFIPILGKQIWLRRKVFIPESWKGKRIFLNFDSARYITEVYINRNYTGRHVGIEPFVIDLTCNVQCGKENEILIFVGNKNYLQNSYCKGIAYPSSPKHSFGIIQDITLTAQPKVSLSSAYAFMRNHNTLEFRGKILGEISLSDDFDIEIKLANLNSSITFGKYKLKPGADGSFAIQLPWKLPVLWGIGGQYQLPNLFMLSSTLYKNGKLVDDYSYRTGFSRFQICDKTKFCLNGKDIVLQGDHLWASEGHYGPTNRPFMMRYFRIAREANFNIVRTHVIEGGNPYPAVLDVADELGFMVEPEGPFCAGSKVPRVDGEPNYIDPVFIKNAEAYYRSIARKIRVHPSCVIFSASNEVFQVIGEFLDDASVFFLRMEDVVHEEAPDMVITQQGNNWRKEFATADVHYAYGKPLENWSKRGNRPLIHGEYNYMQGYYFDMNHEDRRRAARAIQATAKKFEDEIKFEIANGVAGTFPFPPLYIFSFSTADKSLMGPFADVLSGKKVKKFNRWYMPYSLNARIPVSWPAMSGKGLKIPFIYCGTQADNINFFDSTRPECTLNEVYFAFQRGFNKMPPLRSHINPEVIIQLNHFEDGFAVWVVSKDGTWMEGSLPDKDGKVWFVLPAAGEYRAFYWSDKYHREIKFNIASPALIQKPGYGYIKTLRL